MSNKIGEFFSNVCGLLRIIELYKTKCSIIFRPPFTASDPMKIYNIILRGIEQIEFPRHVTKTAITIIRKFCRENPTERLGYQKDGIQDIKKHRWYQGFDWEGLEARTLSPPIVPKVS